MARADNAHSHANHHRYQRGNSHQNDVLAGGFGDIVDERFENVWVQGKLFLELLPKGAANSANSVSKPLIPEFSVCPLPSARHFFGRFIQKIRLALQRLRHPHNLFVRLAQRFCSMASRTPGGVFTP
jgi:hypothetical protein